MHWDQFAPYVPYILQGVKVTLFYTGSSFLGGFLLGILLVACKISSSIILKKLAQFYTSIFRGTPLILQLTFAYYASHNLTGVRLEVWQAGILAFSLNSGAYISEILRAGFQSLDKGQWEAAYVLGIPRWYIMQDILLPQVLRRVLPSLVNEMVDLLKESSLVSAISETDLMRRATIVAAQTHTYFEPFVVVGAIYYICVMLLNSLAHLMEKKWTKKISSSCAI